MEPPAPLLGKSEVADLIKYKPIDFPKWRHIVGQGGEVEKQKSVGDMLKEIQMFQARWQQQQREDKVDKAVHVDSVLRQMEIKFYFHVNLEEEHGLGTYEETEEMIGNIVHKMKLKRSFSREEQEVVNLYHAYQNLKELLLDKENTCLLAEQVLLETHKKILKSVDLHGRTPAGVYSDNIKYAEYNGETYRYQGMAGLTTQQAAQCILDRYNSLLQAIKEHWNSNGNRLECIEDVFKSSAYLVFEMLDLHPFSDGNGRLCRLLASYALAIMTPFPTPVYNIWSRTSKYDYIDALIEARKSDTRQPCHLVSMMVECNWHGWKEFFEKLCLNDI
eukprot:Seg916.3 transcript_id=Seg916.3/GoldUCD/mRNA.D3Y31 product="hypothetical protein" protein_id=Seg916.3/GoldUCD/D3Y31